MNIVISDTSCLIALDRIGRLDILQKTFSEIYITETIRKEFEYPLPGWIIIRSVKDLSQQRELELVLDAGEASAIALAMEITNAVLIIDEKKGRRIAQNLNLSIIGTLKVLLIAKKKQAIASVKEIIEQLNKHSFRFNKLLIDEVLKLAGEV